MAYIHRRQPIGFSLSGLDSAVILLSVAFSFHRLGRPVCALSGSWLADALVSSVLLSSFLFKRAVVLLILT